ncbi:hypothetical protein [Neptunomonas marina]|uniref:Uncharacterized protein n=1 Tax=Neptunomonas marina TaxID=1815562 RepID=A0A437QCN8_9GAMM|nr:hypothetical protein [Neptunomonas marina]RVU32286.1 hypothetical protein EOE65_01140 [Neptunomonas marina]
MEYSIFARKNNILLRSALDIQGIPVSAGMAVRVVNIDIARYRFDNLSQINFLSSLLNEVHTVERIDDEGKIWITRWVEGRAGERQRHVLSLSGENVLLEYDWLESQPSLAEAGTLVA